MTCPLCGHQDARSQYLGAQRDEDIFECPTCGRFVISKALALLKKEELDQSGYLLSGLARQAKEQKGEPPRFTTDNLDSLVGNRRVAGGFLDRLDLLLLFLARKSSRAGDEVTVVPTNDYPVAFAKDAEEFDYMLNALSELGFVERTTFLGMDLSDGQQVTITINGWARTDEKRLDSAEGNQCFVAMWFDPQVEDAYSLGIQPALLETGFQPFRVDKAEHNDKIDDLIVAQIRRSSLLVSDVTGHRQGVYFEAGLAMGLSIPVIWTCHVDHISHCHFDTRQYNHIVWDTPSALRERLRNRILATIPRR